MGIGFLFVGKAWHMHAPPGRWLWAGALSAQVAASIHTHRHATQGLSGGERARMRLLWLVWCWICSMCGGWATRLCRSLGARQTPHSGTMQRTARTFAVARVRCDKANSNRASGLKAMQHLFYTANVTVPVFVRCDLKVYVAAGARRRRHEDT